MLHPLRPCHLADMNEAFDALLQLDKSSVVGDAENASSNARTDWITLRGIEPWIRRELLKSERNALFVFVELKHLYVNLVADIHQIARMREPSPRHVGDVQQAIEAAEIDESSVVGEVLHGACKH